MGFFSISIVPHLPSSCHDPSSAKIPGLTCWALLKKWGICDPCVEWMQFVLIRLLMDGQGPGKGDSTS